MTGPKEVKRIEKHYSNGRLDLLQILYDDMTQYLASYRDNGSLWYKGFHDKENRRIGYWEFDPLISMGIKVFYLPL